MGFGGINMEQHHHRGNFGSSIGFLMAAIGSAVGLGNLWGFPYKMGANGGAAFLIVYLVLIVAVGFPVLMGEIAIGRKTGRSAVGAFRRMDGRFPLVGYMGVISGTVVVAYYSVLGGLCLRYCFGFLLEFLGLNGFSATGAAFFESFSRSTGALIVCSGLFAGITGLILAGGVQKGIEKFSSVVMPLLFVMLVALVVYIARQPGAAEGYRFVFSPDFTYLKENFFSVVTTAAGQMFFSLSLAMGVMVAYGSYLSKEENIARDAAVVCGADTLIAILAGSLVIPAAITFVGPDAHLSGMKLLFVTMHEVFYNIGGKFGLLLGFFFFLVVIIAAFTSSVSLLEVSISCIVDRRIDRHQPPKRRTVALACTVLVFVMSLPVALDAVGLIEGRTPLALLRHLFASLPAQTWNGSFLDLYDMLTASCLMPLGALLTSLLIGWRYGTKTITDECGIRENRLLTICYKVIVPIVMLVVLYGQIRSFFG